ncbi:hypothetical protein [Thiolinea disciformis]|nr:hypothetical protein [Thiolinea disciformis]
MLHHPEPNRIKRLLASLQMDVEIAVMESDQAKVEAYLKTAKGEVRL